MTGLNVARQGGAHQTSHVGKCYDRCDEGVANKQVRGTDVVDGEMCVRLALGGVEGNNTIERDVLKQHFSVQTGAVLAV